MTKYHILLIEDNKDTADFLGAYLIQWGYDVETVSDGQEGWNAFNRREFHLVIANLDLPQINGLRLCVLIKEAARGKVPVLLVSASELTDRIKKELPPDKRPDGILIKPFPPALLQENIQFLLPEKHPSLKKNAHHSPRSFPLQGDFKELSFPRLLFLLYKNHATGMLAMKLDHIWSRVYLLNGFTVFASSNKLETNLGRMLLNERIISEKEYLNILSKLSEAKVEEPNVKFGEILIKTGLLTPKEVCDALEHQVISILTSWFNQDEARYSFQADENFINETIMFKIPMLHVLKIGIKNCLSADKLERIIAPLLARYPFLTDGFLQHRQEYCFTPLEERFLTHLKGVTRLRDILSENPLGASDAYQLLYLLMVADSLELRDNPLLPGSIRDHNRLNIETPDDKQTKKVTDTSRTERIQEEIIQDYLYLKTRNYYQMLGVTPKATAEEVQREFVRIAEKFRPDKLDQNLPGEYKEKASEILAKLTWACRTLTDPLLKEQYDLKLDGNKPITREVGAVSENKVLNAEIFYKEGERFLKAKNYSRAKERLAKAVELHPEEPQYLILLAWAVYLRSGGKSVVDAIQAKKYLERALEINSHLEYAYYYLGLIAKAEGKTEAARQYFAQAIACNQDFLEAKREMRLLQQRTPNS